MELLTLKFNHTEKMKLKRKIPLQKYGLHINAVFVHAKHKTGEFRENYDLKRSESKTF